MDAQTDLLFEALQYPERLVILAVLLQSESTELELRLKLELDQTVANRALREMRLVGLLRRDRPKGPNRVAFPAATRAFLLAANTLALKIDEQRRRADEEFRERLS